MPTDAVKSDISYKRFSKRQYTSLLKRWHEEYPGKPLNIKLKDIWVDPISSTPPGSSTSTIQVINLRLTEDVTVDGSLSWVACSTPNSLSTRIGDFIQPDQDISQSYYIKVFDNDGLPISVGNSCNWEFDYANGILTFESQPSGFSAPFHVQGYRYVGRLVENLSELVSATLDSAYDGASGSGSGKIINVDFGPVTINATNGSAALQINPIEYTPENNLADGQIINRSGILYVYDNSRSLWISMQRQNIVFGAKRADGRFLNLSSFSSNMAGWPALRSGVILGISAQGSGGYANKEFKILKNDVLLQSFNLSNHYYANGNMNLSFDANDLVKVLASSEYGTTLNVIINIEIGWRI